LSTLSVLPGSHPVRADHRPAKQLASTADHVAAID
jgi:hypothetical protein